MNSMTKADCRTYLADHGIKATARTSLSELRSLYAAVVAATDPEQASVTVEERVEEPESAEEQAVAHFTAEPVEQAERTADATYAARGNYNTVYVPAALVLAEEFAGVEVWSEKVSGMLVNVHTAGPRAVEFLRLLESSVESAQGSLKTWQRMQERDGHTDMQKFNANRSYLAGYLAAVSGAKKLPTIAFAKDMSKAVVLDAVKAGAVARKAEATV